MAGSNEFQPADEMEKRLREKTPEELMEEMEALSSTPDYDVELLCTYLDILEEKAPVLPDGYSPTTDFERFQEARAELFHAPRGESGASCPPTSAKKRVWRFKRIAAAFAAALCLLLVVAEASSPGTFERIIKWGSEIFSLQSKYGSMELPSASGSGFLSLQEALDHYGIDGAVIPTRIPRRYAISKVTDFKANDALLLSGKYVAEGNDVLLIRVAIDPRGAYSFEENLTEGHILYEVNGMTFVLSNNFDEQRATWSESGCVCSISGEITEEELKEMLDSVNDQ